MQNYLNVLDAHNCLQQNPITVKYIPLQRCLNLILNFAVTK